MVALPLPTVPSRSSPVLSMTYLAPNSSPVLNVIATGDACPVSPYLAEPSHEESIPHDLNVISSRGSLPYPTPPFTTMPILAEPGPKMDPTI